MLESSPYRQEDESLDDLPPGCTILNRSARPTPSDSPPTGVKALRTGRNDSRGKASRLEVTAPAMESPGSRSSLAAPAAALTAILSSSTLSSASSTTPRRRSTAEIPPPQKPSESARATSLTAGISSVAGKGKFRRGSEEGVGSGVTAAAVAAAAVMKAGVSQSQHGGPTPLPSPQGGAGAGGIACSAVRYNPGPTFGSSRGRTKKRLLDASLVTVDDTVGREKVLALVADSTLQKVCTVD